MNLRTRLLALTSVASMFVGIGAIGMMPAGAVTTTYNVANDHVTCNTLTGTIAFATALSNAGGSTGANKITVKGTVGGCFDDDRSAVTMFGGTINSVINTNNGTNCTGLLGPSNISGSAQIVWKPGKGDAFTPTTTVGSAQKPASNITFSQVSGGTFSVPASESPWASAYGKFSIGTPYGTTPLSSSVDFTGGDTGATSWFSGTTQQDLGMILGLCGGAGIKKLSFGIGALHGG